MQNANLTHVEHNDFYHLEVPILFIVFNRLECTKQVFKSIQKVKPKRLYIASDGPRFNIENEGIKVRDVRNYILENIDWNCEVKTLFQSENLGCKYAVSKSISWFFENEEQGIILEDDCLPDYSFFFFCQTLLNKYANNDLVYQIAGSNLYDNMKFNSASYFFTKNVHIWGWATWRRAWLKYDIRISFWDVWKNTKNFDSLFLNKLEKVYWYKIFSKQANNKIDTWDYSWISSIWYNNGVTIVPSFNLVKNIGFGIEGTHTKDEKSRFSNIDTYQMENIVHPNRIERCKKSEIYMIDKVLVLGLLNKIKLFFKKNL